MNKKAYLQISFSWIFAIIVGAFILFLAIFAVTKFIGTGTMSQDVKIAKEIGVLLNPLETGFEQGRITTLKLPVESRIYSRCETENVINDFGYQNIIVREKIYEKWSDTDIEVSFENKYLFSEEYVEGEVFYLFSKPFSFPFKTASLIYLTSVKDKYCFVNAPADIEDEIMDLKPKNIFLEGVTEMDCPGSENEIQVCFSGNANCEIQVESNHVIKYGERLYYEDNLALMYAAIFSNSELYECQVKRLVMREKTLTELYKQKLSLLSLANCQSFLLPDLSILESTLENYLISGGSENLDQLSQISKSLDRKNQHSVCRLW